MLTVRMGKFENYKLKLNPEQRRAQSGTPVSLGLKGWATFESSTCNKQPYVSCICFNLLFLKFSFIFYHQPSSSNFPLAPS